jgi:hypothetical protein
MLKFFSHLSKINLQSNLIGLIFILFIMLIPIIGFLSPKQEKSLTENRNLTIKVDFKTLTLKNFSTQINNYLNDTFGLRNYFIQFNNTIKYIFKVIISKPHETIMYGKDNFLFLQQYSFFYYLSKEQISNQVNVVTNNLKKARDAYPSSIPIFFISIPTKEYLYKDKLPNFIKVNNNRDIFINQLQQSLSNIKGLYYLDLNIFLIQQKNNNPQELLYYKGDHHFTSYTSYISYKEIIKFINSNTRYNLNLPRKSSLDIFINPTLPLDFKECRLLIGFSKKLLKKCMKNDLNLKEVKIKYKNNIIKKEFKCSDDNNINCSSSNHFFYDRDINSQNHKRILIFGDSFIWLDTIGLKNFFTAYNFYDVYYIHNNWTTANKDIYKKIVTEMKPDIILIIQAAGYF